MNVTNQKDEQRKRIHKAANTIAENQTAWKDFYAKPSHKIAREVITKGKASLDQQNTTGFLCLMLTQSNASVGLFKFVKESLHEPDNFVVKLGLRIDKTLPC